MNVGCGYVCDSLHFCSFVWANVQIPVCPECECLACTCVPHVVATHVKIVPINI